VAAPGTTESDVLVQAAAVESTSEHPLAKAIVTEARRRNVSLLQASNFQALAGRGAKAVVNGNTVTVGGPRLLAETGLTATPDVAKSVTAWEGEGRAVLYAFADGRLLGALAAEDEIRPESKKQLPTYIRSGSGWR